MAVVKSVCLRRRMCGAAFTYILEEEPPIETPRIQPYSQTSLLPIVQHPSSLLEDLSPLTLCNLYKQTELTNINKHLQHV